MVAALQNKMLRSIFKALSMRAGRDSMRGARVV
jgi:hypothetical protein